MAPIPIGFEDDTINEINKLCKYEKKITTFNELADLSKDSDGVV